MSHELKSINEFNIEKYLRESKDRGANIMTLRQQSEYIIRHALHSVLPDEAVKAVLTGIDSARLWMIVENYILLQSGKLHGRWRRRQ